MQTLEKEIEQKLRRAVERHDGRCLKWVCPGWAGVPDRIVLLPGARVVFVETKRPVGGRLSALQKKWRGWLSDLGFECWVVWSWADLERFQTQVLEGCR